MKGALSMKESCYIVNGKCERCHKALFRCETCGKEIRVCPEDVLDGMIPHCKDHGEMIQMSNIGLTRLCEYKKGFRHSALADDKSAR